MHRFALLPRASDVARDPLLRLLAAIFLFNLGAAAWSAVVAGRLAQAGEGVAVLGTLYAVCEVVRFPAALLLPAVTLRLGARRITQVGLVALVALPLVAIGGLSDSRIMLSLVLSALPSMAVYVGLPALVLGVARPGKDGWALALMGLAGGAGGALGPWIGGTLADSYGLLPSLLLFGAGSAVLLPMTRGHLPDASPWPGWKALAGHSLPWQAIAALALASAADAGRAALVPMELVKRGLPLGEAGFLLSVGCAVAGTGFLVFGRIADRQPPMRMLGAGLFILVAGCFAAASVSNWSIAYAIASAVLGMGASGIRLAAQVSLIAWIGRDRAGVAAALGETTVMSGRAVGAPTIGVLGDAHGGSYAFTAMGLVGVATAGLLVLHAMDLLHRPRRGMRSAA